MRAAYHFTHTLVASGILTAALLTPTMAMATGDSGGVVRYYVGHDSPNPFTFFDFVAGEYKGECVSGGTVVGVSALTSSKTPLQILCETPEAVPILFSQAASGVTPSGYETNETISSSDSADFGHHGGDWDSGFFKAECPVSSMVVGIGQTTDASQKVDTVHCSSTNLASCAAYSFHYPTNTTCHTVNLSGQTNPYWGNSWSIGYSASCGSGEVVVGVSTDTTNHHPHSILCCQAPSSSC